MTEFIFFGSILSLFYIYIGYYACLKLLVRLCNYEPPGARHPVADFAPRVSVIVAAFDEEKEIEKRIQNLLSMDYHGEIEIIIASDGSTDGTVEIASRYKDRGVTVFDFKENRGRAAVHNDAVKHATGGIILFTDAGTVFEKDFVEKIVEPFRDNRIGCAVGRLRFYDKATGINRAEGLYWKWEVRTRLLQEKIGALMTGSGACTAFRKSLFKPLRPIDDIDFATTIDTILAGKKITYVESAVAYDEAPSTLKMELNGRIRAAKRLIGTVSRWGATNWLRHPVYSWTLLSHKILRWMSPFFIILVILSNIALLGRPFYNLTFITISYMAVLTGFGALAHYLGKHIPVASTFFSFFMANVGFFVGITRALRGRVTTKYKMPSS